jgi:hypothetical protein
MGFRWAKGLESEMKDPAARERKVKEILGAKELPEGYHAVMGFSVPFLMEAAILSDKPPGASGEPQSLGERGFIYFKFIAAGQDQKELKDYFEGKTNDPAVLRKNNINIQSSEILRRGVVEVGGQNLLYLSQRGSVNFQGNAQQGLSAFILVECKGDQRFRMGIWFAPDPTRPPAAPDPGQAEAALGSPGAAPGEPEASEGLKVRVGVLSGPAEAAPGPAEAAPVPPELAEALRGTPADEDAIRDFMGHFRPCD